MIAAGDGSAPSSGAAETEIRRHAVTYLIARGGAGLIQLVTIAVFARILGPRDYAVFALVTGAAFSVGEILTQWTQQSMVRFYPQAAANAEEWMFDATVVSALRVQLAVAGLVAIGAVMVTLGVHGDVAVAAAGGALGLVTCVFNTFRARFQASLAPVRWAAYTVVANSARLILGLALIPIAGRALGPIVGATVALLLLVGPIARSAGFTRRAREADADVAERLRRWWTYGWPLSGWSASMQVLALADRYILLWIRGAVSAGLYSSIYDVTTKSTFPVFDAVVLSIQPHVHHSASDPARVRSLVRMSCRYLLLAMMPLIAFSVVAHREIVQLLVGGAYAPYSGIAPLLLAGVLLWALASATQKLLEVQGRTREIFAGIGAAAIANIVMSVLLIWLYGIKGAAVATLCSYAVFLAVIDVVGRVTLDWRFPLRSVAVTGGAAAAAACVGWLAGRPVHSQAGRLAVEGLVLTLVYVAGAVVGRELPTTILHPGRGRRTADSGDP